MVTQHYRWDFIGLSTDTKPTPQTSEKVVDGSTYYEADTSKLYVYCKNYWYEKKSLGSIKLLSSADITRHLEDEDEDVIEVWKLPEGIYIYQKSDFYLVLSMTQNDEEYDIDETEGGNCIIITTGMPTEEMPTTDYTIFDNLGFIAFEAVDEHGVPELFRTSGQFTGTDGENNGIGGSVPAPTTEDNGYFLCADGTWKPIGE